MHTPGYKGSKVSSFEEDQYSGTCYISSIPSFLMYRVFRYVMPVDLLSCCRVNKQWGVLASDNKLWWPVAMEAWYLEDNRPKVFPKNNTKQNWKSMFLSVGSTGNASLTSTRTTDKQQTTNRNTFAVANCISEKIEWKEPLQTKEDKRKWYKSDRRNLRDKLSERRNGRRNKIATQSECDL